MTAIMGLVHHQLQLWESEEMAAIIADDSAARANGHVAYQDCRCVIVREGFCEQTVKGKSHSGTKTTAAGQIRWDNVLLYLPHAIKDQLDIFQQIMSGRKTHSDRGKGQRTCSNCDKNMPYSEEGCSQATTQRNTWSVVRLLSRGLENKPK